MTGSRLFHNPILTRSRKKYLDHLAASRVRDFGQMIKLSNSADDLTPNDLIYLITNSNSENVRCGAYLRLIKHGELNDLRRLAPHMDFDSTLGYDGDAMAIAAAYGRADVMHFFKEELGIGLHQFSDDYEDEGVDLVLAAARQNQWATIDEIMKPADQGGLGYRLPQDVLVNFNAQNSVVIVQQPNVFNQHQETVSVYNYQTGHRDDFHKAGYLGRGGYGSVYAFKHDDSVLAVKMPNKEWYDQGDLYNTWYDILNEFKYLHKAYPEEGPYALQKVVNVYHQASYRMVMPFVPGEIFTTALRSAKSDLEQAEVVLLAAEAIKAVHQKSMTHGDIRSSNILITGNKDGNPPKAHLIDFNFSATINQKAQTLHTRDNAKFFAPELVGLNLKVLAHPAQDVYAFARTMQYVICNLFHPSVAFAAMSSRDALAKLHEFCVTDESWQKENQSLFKSFPVLKEFIRDGLADAPQLRPALSDFILELKDQIADMKYNANNPHKSKRQRTSTSAKGMFAGNRQRLQDDEMSDDRPTKRSGAINKAI